MFVALHVGSCMFAVFAKPSTNTPLAYISHHPPDPSLPLTNPLYLCATLCVC